MDDLMTQADDLHMGIDDGWNEIITMEEELENLRWAAQSEMDTNAQQAAWAAFDNADRKLEKKREQISTWEFEVQQVYYEMEDMEWMQRQNTALKEADKAGVDLLALFNQADYYTIELEHAKADKVLLEEAVKTDASKQGQLDGLNGQIAHIEEWLGNLDAIVQESNDFVAERTAEVV